MSKLSKREFVKGAAAVVTAGLVLPGRSAPATFAIVVVYNDWHRQAQTFAAALSERGAQALAVQGDAGRLWYARLRGLVRGGSRRIAGMTTHTDLLILETLARDEGLKVRRRNSVGGARLVSWVMT
jgi:hypothetical protein